MLASVYEFDGDLLAPTELARGPWDPRAQHGGPACAALGGALERADPPDGFAVVRFAADFLGPVPMKPLRIETRIARGGRRVQLIEGALLDGDTPVARASAWRMRIGSDVAPAAESGTPPPGPDTAELHRPFRESLGFWAAVEWRFVAGRFEEIGPATGWCRLKVPLVDGEEPSPLQRVLVAADFGNGISNAVDWTAHVFVNVDLTVHLHRQPEGEWVCLDATTDVDTRGVGLATSRLYDERGPIGRGAQSLLIDRRRDSA